MKQILNNSLFTLLLFATSSSLAAAKSNEVLQCFNTGSHTVMKVREAKTKKESLIIGSDYDGNIIAVDFKGKVLWSSKTGKGSMNHDIWCDDITGDGVDEIFAANANGSTYAFNINGKLLWSFCPPLAPHTPPMYSVTVVKDSNKTPYVVCGGFDLNLYYLNFKGEMVKSIASKKYSKVKPWGQINRPPNFASYPNFLRPIPLKDGSDLLVNVSSNNHMQAAGHIYLMRPLEETVYAQYLKPDVEGTISDFRVQDPDKDGIYEFIYGGSTLVGANCARLLFDDNTYKTGKVYPIDLDGRNSGKTAYRVNQFFSYQTKDGYDYALFTSNQVMAFDKGEGEPAGKNKYSSKLTSNYTFNDFWVAEGGKLLLASSQDGGSCVYILDTKNKGWMKAYASIEPKGKIETIIKKEHELRKELKNFEKPKYQRNPVTVINYEGGGETYKHTLRNNKALQFSGGRWGNYKNEEPSWRKALYTPGSKYLSPKDRRGKYNSTSEECVEFYSGIFNETPHGNMWAGHGNDPLYYSLKTLKAIADVGAKRGKTTCFIWPEMNNHDAPFAEVIDKHIMPLAEHLKKINGKIAIRTKDIFFSGTIHLPMWSRYVSGEFADVFIPEMEETTDKTQDISLAGRVGLWMAGSVNGWGVRCSRDESSFDRSRQYGSQQLANHFFRKTLYSLASGAKYIHNATMNERHMGLYLELLNKEALYVPKREEVLSFSPVHISMVNPQASFIHEGENNKWNTFYDKAKEDANPALFSHMNGSWIGGTLTPWDYSTIASGVIDRRQNIIPPYPYGLVAITPVQNGVLADKNAPRGKMADKLHPIYKNILREYITDGVDIISADGKSRTKANIAYKQIEKNIIEGAKLLPINIKTISGGKAAWVVAQMSPKVLRLTLVDGGYLNPMGGTVKVTFNRGIKPVKMVDVLDKKEFNCSKLSNIEVDVPCGMFRFIDIELAQPLK